MQAVFFQGLVSADGMGLCFLITSVIIIEMTTSSQIPAVTPLKRQPRPQASKTREALLERAAAHVKAQGFASSGVDAIAAAADLTSGAVYRHFRGKADLFAALVRTQLQQTTQRFAAVSCGDARATHKTLAAYLSVAHVEHPAQGCPLPSLTPEVARSDPAVRQAFQDGLIEVHAQVARLTQSEDRAWALISQCVGAVMLARATNAPDTRAALLRAAMTEASNLLQLPEDIPHE